MKKYITLAFLLLISFITIAQHEGYKHLINIPPPHYTTIGNRRNFHMNGIMISQSSKYLVIDYGRKVSSLAIFTFPDFELVGLRRIEKNVELSQSYFDVKDSLLFVKTDRYAPDYTMIRIYDMRPMIVPCNKTPRGCPSEPAGFAKIETFSPDKKYLLQRAHDKMTLKVYIKE